MPAAEAAIGGAEGGGGAGGVGQAGQFFEAPIRGFEEEADVAVDDVAEIAVVWAGFFDEDSGVFDKVAPDDDGRAFGAKGLDGARQGTGVGLDGAAAEGAGGGAGAVGGRGGPDRVVVDFGEGAATGTVVGEEQLAAGFIGPIKAGGDLVVAAGTGGLGGQRQLGEQVTKTKQGGTMAAEGVGQAGSVRRRNRHMGHRFRGVGSGSRVTDGGQGCFSC